MALTNESIFSAQDFIALKARVNAEVQRRCRNGDISSYANQYTNVPSNESIINIEHVNKIMEPLSKINSQGTYTAKDQDVVKALKNAADYLTNYEKEQMAYGASSSCNASCTGLCTTSCWNDCTGCTSCSGCGGCGGCSSCSDGCASGCGYACGWSCTSTCTGGCKGNCGSSCSSNCTGYCTLISN